jgi:hypothetical protein
MKSRWITSEFGPRGHYEDRPKKNMVSLQPRLDAIINHISEQIADLESYGCKTTSFNHKGFNNKESFQLEEYSMFATIPFQLNCLDQKCNLITGMSKTLLERVSDQLKTVSDLGDIVVILSPAVLILKSIRSSLVQCIPECYQELCYICELIEVVLVDAAQVGGYTINFQTANESALSWMSEVKSKN